MSDPSEPSEKPDTQGPSAENIAAPAEAIRPGPDVAAGSDGSALPSSAEAAVGIAPVAGEAGLAETGGDPAMSGPGAAELAALGHAADAAPSELTAEQIEILRKRRKDKTIGLVIVTTTFILSMIGSLYAKKLAEPELSEPPGPPTTEGVENWPKKVDPFQVLGVAREVTKRNLFRGFVAEMVKSDGTMDFSKKGPRLRYSFQSEPGHGPQPSRKPGTLPRRTYCGKQNVHVKNLGVVADPDMASYPCATVEKEPLPDPTCTPKDVWAHALKKGAPKKKAARIEYYLAEAGPAYRFNLPGTKHRFSLSGDCARELKGREAAGGVP